MSVFFWLPLAVSHACVVFIRFQLPSGLSNGGLLNFASSTNDANAAFNSGFAVAEQLIVVGIGLVVGVSGFPIEFLAQLTWWTALWSRGTHISNSVKEGKGLDVLLISLVTPNYPISIKIPSFPSHGQ